MTPALLRYKQLKDQNPKAILLYRMGDFYEAFFEDAVTIAKTLDIALTSRDKGPNKTPMAGIPYHALETYLSKLIDAGFKVAVAEQHEQKVKDEKTNKTKIIINRNLSKIVTPSTYDRENDYNSHFLCSVYIEDVKKLYVKNSKKINPIIGISVIDPNGSEFWSTYYSSIADLDNELFKLNPSEILIREDFLPNINISRYLSSHLQYITPQQSTKFKNLNDLLQHFSVSTFKSFGIEVEEEMYCAAACFNYLRETQNTNLDHIKKIYHKKTNAFMHIDSNTLRNLEIINSTSSTGISLLSVLDYTCTRGGKRLLKEWLISPLLDNTLIQNRHDALNDISKKDINLISNILNSIFDLERVCARLSYDTISPRDFISLKNSLIKSYELVDIINDLCSTNIINIKEIILAERQSLEELISQIENTIKDPAPASIKDGHVINKNISKELDELYEITQNNKTWLRNLEIMEQQKSGIPSLKVKYNRVFGYFIEVSKSYTNRVPESYIRKQTTVNGERYITTELKEKESLILGANDRIIELETEIYREFVNNSKKYIQNILNIQKAVSELDVYYSLYTSAKINNYVCPIWNTNSEIHIIDGRHPIIEKITKEQYIYNDIHLKDGELILITGPNMGGKSTYIRMCALIAYMAHIGSFVPAKECSMTSIDSIFTRVGASDDLSKGESTFMVEMTEAANILRNSSSQSLIILDEIGRGTSTYDGMSIAWSIVYYIHQKVKAKTLFATHYHELTALEMELERLSNYTVAISENNGHVVFLRKIQKGKAEKSFGIHVAKLAGLPDPVLEKATEILHELEKKEAKNRQYNIWEFTDTSYNNEIKELKKKLQKYEDVILSLEKLDPNNLTPIEALQKIDETRKILNNL